MVKELLIHERTANEVESKLRLENRGGLKLVNFTN